MLKPIEIISDETIQREGITRLIVNTTIPQEIVLLNCRNKNYIIKSNENGKLQMTVNSEINENIKIAGNELWYAKDVVEVNN